MKKKIESFADFARMLEGGDIKGYYNIHNTSGVCCLASTVDYEDFYKGFQYIEVPDEKSDREKCADLITQNEYVIYNNTYYPTAMLLFDEACDNILIPGIGRVSYSYLISHYFPATKTERDAAMYK